jgi:hypothetical protein
MGSCPDGQQVPKDTTTCLAGRGWPRARLAVRVETTQLARRGYAYCVYCYAYCVSVSTAKQGWLRRALSNLKWQFRFFISVRIRIGRNSNGLECCSTSCEQRFASPPTACTDLSRRLRDGVSLYLYLPLPSSAGLAAVGSPSGLPELDAHTAAHNLTNSSSPSNRSSRRRMLPLPAFRGRGTGLSQW